MLWEKKNRLNAFPIYYYSKIAHIQDRRGTLELKRM